MSRWRWYTPAPKQPVPRDGLAARRFGTTWWGREWMAALGRLGSAYSSRLPRGATYARAGRVVDLAVGAGSVTAGVVGTRPRPYQVSIRLACFDEDTWRAVVEALGKAAALTIRLLDQELPEEVGHALRQRGVELFPHGPGDLETDCSCPDWANPCKHVAAVHYVFAAALDADPFLLFRLRGMARDHLLAALAGEQGGGAAEASAPAAAAQPEEWEAPAPMDESDYVGSCLTGNEVQLNPRPPELELFGLRRLGPPPPALERLPDLLAPAVRAAVRRALELAWGTDGAADETGVAPAQQLPAQGHQPRTRPDGRESWKSIEQRLIAALESARAPLPLTTLAGTLDVRAERLRSLLFALRNTGRVEMVGARRGACYRLAPTKKQRTARPQASARSRKE